MIVDYSPLDGMQFNCLDDCGLCCTYQPELMRQEHRFYKTNKLTKTGIVAGNIGNSDKNNTMSFNLQNTIGACTFLKNKKCQIYDIRPLKCRTFPINIYFGWRIQLYFNMSCRGLWNENKSNNLHSLGEELFFGLHKHTVRQLFDISRKQYQSLQIHLKTYIPPDELRTEILKKVKNFQIDPYENYKDAEVNFKFSLQHEEFKDLPIHLAEDLKWHIFKLENDTIQRIQLEENGFFNTKDSINISNVGIKPISANAMKLITNYIQTVAERDHFIGIVYQRSLAGCNEPLIDSAIDTLKIISTLTIINSSMLAEFHSREEIDDKVIKEGISLTDGHVSILPSIGSIM